MARTSWKAAALLAGVAALAWWGRAEVSRESRRSVRMRAPAESEPAGGATRRSAGIEAGGRRRAADSSEGGGEGPGRGEEGAATETSSRSVRILLLDANSSLPVPGAILAVRPMGSWPEANREERTGRDGRLEFVLAPGIWRVEHIAVPGDPDWTERFLTPWRFEVHPEEDLDLVVTAHAPDGVLGVDVVRAGGERVRGASVVLTPVGFEGRAWWNSGLTGESGRAWISLRRGIGDARLFARLGDEVSELLELRSPVPGSVLTLDLAPGAALAVTVVEDPSVPTPAFVSLARGAFEVGEAPRMTDSTGFLRLEGLFPGPVDVVAFDPRRRIHASEHLELARGEVRSVRLVFPRRPISQIEGRVLEEGGRPLGGVNLLARNASGWSGTAETSGDGTFAFDPPSVEPVEISASLDSEGDLFDPPVQWAEAGDREVVFRRKELARERTFVLEVVDRLTGEPIEDYALRIDRGPGSEELGDVRLPSPRYTLRSVPSTRIAVEAVGHVGRSMLLEEALGKLPPTEPLRVTLDRGLDTSVCVRASGTGAPIDGAVFHSHDWGDAVTGIDGVVRLRAPEWSIYRVEAPGFQVEEWDPEFWVLWGGGTIFLEAASAEPDDSAAGE